MPLIGVDRVGHRHAGNRGAKLITGFDCAALEFETVRSSGRHIVSIKIKRTPTSVRLIKLRRFQQSMTDGAVRGLTLQAHSSLDKAVS